MVTAPKTVDWHMNVFSQLSGTTFHYLYYCKKVNPKQRSKRMLWEEVIYAHKEIQDFAQLDPKGMAHTKYMQVGGIP